jgi:hypothetical protein
MFQANLYGIMGLATIAMCWAFAVVLYRVGAPGSVARMLAVLLVIEGFILVTGGYVAVLFTPATLASSWISDWYQISEIVHHISDCAMLALYPPFLAAALQTKLTRPFADKRMRIGLAVASVALFFAVSLSSFEIGHTLLYATMLLLFGYALVASFHAWRVAAPGIARTRAGIFTLAFGLRDVCWGFIYAHGISLIVRGLMGEPEPDFFYVIYAGGTFLAVPLIAYGILRTQLFDIDLRIRWTIKQSTLAAAIVAIMFALSEGAERLLSSDLGNVGSLIVAALVVFALTPLQRFAERVATVAMPNTEDTPEYAASRKLQVYEAALAEALPDGNISERERELLNRLRDSLGISASDADAIEGELLKRQLSFA